MLTILEGWIHELKIWRSFLILIDATLGVSDERVQETVDEVREGPTCPSFEVPTYVIHNSQT